MQLQIANYYQHYKIFTEHGSYINDRRLQALCVCLFLLFVFQREHSKTK